jgi:hypothetical protein
MLLSSVRSAIGSGHSIQAGLFHIQPAMIAGEAAIDHAARRSHAVANFVRLVTCRHHATSLTRSSGNRRVFAIAQSFRRNANPNGKCRNGTSTSFAKTPAG